MVEYIHSALKKIKTDQVVRGGPTEELARSKLETTTIVPGGAEITGVSVVPDPAVPRSVVTADLFAAISRTVVREDELEIAVCLVEMGLNGSCDVLFAVVNRHADANAGFAHGCSSREAARALFRGRGAAFANRSPRQTCLGNWPRFPGCASNPERYLL